MIIFNYYTACISFQFVGPNRDGPDGSQPKDNTQATSPNKPEAVVHAMKVWYNFSSSNLNE